LLAGLQLALKQKEEQISGLKAISDGQFRNIKSSKVDRNSGNSRELKTTLTEKANKFEKAVQTRHEDLFKPQIGTLWSYAQEKSEELDDLTEEKKAKKTATAIDEEFLESFLEDIRHELENELSTDMVMFDDLLKDFHDEVKKAMEQNGMKSNVPELQRSELTNELNRSLDIAIRIDRPYSGEATTTGFYEYLMAIRRYQMIFFMMASSFGLSFKSGLKEIMLPLTIILLSVGGYFVITGAQKERLENKKKELKKAQDALFAECKRIFNDVQRDWYTRVRDELRLKVNEMTSSSEKILKSHSTDKMSEFHEKKETVQAKVKELESTEKSIVTQVRSVDKLLSEIRKVKTGTKRTASQIMRSAERANR